MENNDNDDDEPDCSQAPHLLLLNKVYLQKTEECSDDEIKKRKNAAVAKKAREEAQHKAFLAEKEAAKKIATVKKQLLLSLAFAIAEQKVKVEQRGQQHSGNTLLGAPFIPLPRPPGMAPTPEAPGTAPTAPELAPVDFAPSAGAAPGANRSAPHRPAPSAARSAPSAAVLAPSAAESAPSAAGSAPSASGTLRAWVPPALEPRAPGATPGTAPENAALEDFTLEDEDAPEDSSALPALGASKVAASPLGSGGVPAARVAPGIAPGTAGLEDKDAPEDTAPSALLALEASKVAASPLRPGGVQVPLFPHGAAPEANAPEPDAAPGAFHLTPSLQAPAEPGAEAESKSELELELKTEAEPGAEPANRRLAPLVPQPGSAQTHVGVELDDDRFADQQALEAVVTPPATQHKAFTLNKQHEVAVAFALLKAYRVAFEKAKLKQEIALQAAIEVTRFKKQTMIAIALAHNAVELEAEKKKQAIAVYESVLQEGGEVGKLNVIKMNADHIVKETLDALKKHLNAVIKKKDISSKLRDILINTVEKIQYGDIQSVDSTRRILNNIIEDVNGDVRVYVRVLNKNGASSCIKTNHEQIQIDCENTIDNTFKLGNGTESNALIDYKTTFNSDLERLIEQAKNGYSVTFLAYGLSGSGKTYTLFQNGQLFDTIKKLAGDDFHLEKAFELYINRFTPNVVRDGNVAIQEKITSLKVSRDIKIGKVINYFHTLLHGENKHANFLSFQNFLIPASTINPRSTEEIGIPKENTSVDAILEFIKATRKKANRISETFNNTESSRSHLFLTFKVGSGGYITIVDMAGSENPKEILRQEKPPILETLTLLNVMYEGRAATNKTIAKTLEEGFFINESINHMKWFMQNKIGIPEPVYSFDWIKFQSKSIRQIKENEYEPFTSVLIKPKVEMLENVQDSVQMLSILQKINDLGNETLSKFVMICCVRDEPKYCNESLNTLNFASNIAKPLTPHAIKMKLIDRVIHFITQMNVQFAEDVSQTIQDDHVSNAIDEFNNYLDINKNLDWFHQGPYLKQEFDLYKLYFRTQTRHIERYKLEKKIKMYAARVGNRMPAVNSATIEAQIKAETSEFYIKSIAKLLQTAKSIKDGSLSTKKRATQRNILTKFAYNAFEEYINATEIHVEPPKTGVDELQLVQTQIESARLIKNELFKTIKSDKTKYEDWFGAYKNYNALLEKAQTILAQLESDKFQKQNDQYETIRAAAYFNPNLILKQVDVDDISTASQLKLETEVQVLINRIAEAEQRKNKLGDVNGLAESTPYDNERLKVEQLLDELSYNLYLINLKLTQVKERETRRTVVTGGMQPFNTSLKAKAHVFLYMQITRLFIIVLIKWLISQGLVESFRSAMVTFAVVYTLITFFTITILSNHDLGILPSFNLQHSISVIGHILAVWLFTGTAYLVWCKQLHRSTSKQTEALVARVEMASVTIIGAITLTLFAF